MALTVAYYYTPSGRSIQKPLQSGQLEASNIVPRGTFRTDKGREVAGGGGIQPDRLVRPEPLSRLALVLDASGSIVSFASEYVQSHSIDESFTVTPAILDEFQVFLSARNIRPGIGEWLRHRDWMESRLKQEITNLKFGVARGDEVEMQRDVVVQEAVKELTAAGRR